MDIVTVSKASRPKDADETRRHRQRTTRTTGTRNEPRTDEIERSKKMRFEGAARCVGVCVGGGGGECVTSHQGGRQFDGAL